MMIRRMLGIAALLACVMALVIPASASAFAGPRDVSVASNPSYKGWGTVDPNYCPPGQLCALMYQTSVTAYQWYYGQWYRTSRRTGTRVYVWPYGSGWSWTWTSERGWLAMRSEELTYRTGECPPGAMC